MAVMEDWLKKTLHVCPNCKVECDSTLMTNVVAHKFHLKDECPQCHLRMFRFIGEASLKPMEKCGAPPLSAFFTADKRLRCMLCMTEGVPKLFSLAGVGLVCQGCYEDSDVRSAAAQGVRIQAEMGVVGGD